MKFILSSYYLFYFGLVGVYIIFMPKVLLDIGYSPLEVGILYSIAPFMRFLLPFIFKHLIFLSSNIYILSLIVSFFSTIVMIWTIDSFYLYILTTIFFGLSMGVSLPYVETISLSRLSKSHYGKVRLWGSLGFMAIALWLGKVVSSPYEILYYLISMALLTSIFGVIIVRYDNVKKVSIKEEKEFSLYKYWAFWLSIFLMQVGFGGFYNFFTIYETAHNISLETTSFLWSFGVLCEVFMLYFQAKLLEKNLLNIIQFATLITSIRWLILFLYPSSIIITFFSQSLHAISFALYHTATMSYIFKLYTQKRLAQQFFLGIAFGLGGSVGALISGKVYGDYLFLVEAIITFISFLVLIIHQKRRSK
jgi:PPP family 3-phenylpropionic acid transporter